jgi:hypothetical protein
MRRLAVLILISSFLQQSVFGWCSVLPRLICAEYSQSKVVVIAKLTRKQHFQPQDTQDYFEYILETNRTLGGEVGARFRVWEENSSGRASFSWSVGKTYLLFLNTTDEGKWWLYGCGNSAPIEEAEFALKVIESLKDRRGGTIQGLVTDGGRYPPMSTDLSGITIQIRGKDRDYEAVTNSKGVFKVHVPAGHYAVVPVQAGRRFKNDFLGFENPDSVTIVNGGGAQLQFDRGD